MPPKDVGQKGVGGSTSSAAATEATKASSLAREGVQKLTMIVATTTPGAESKSRTKGELINLIMGLGATCHQETLSSHQQGLVLGQVVAQLTKNLNVSDPPATPQNPPGGGGGGTPQTVPAGGPMPTPPKPPPRFRWTAPAAGGGSRAGERDANALLTDSKTNLPCLFFVLGPPAGATPVVVESWSTLLKARFGKETDKEALTTDDLAALLTAGAECIEERTQSSKESTAGGVESLAEALKRIALLETSEKNLAKQVEELQGQLKVSSAPSHLVTYKGASPNREATVIFDAPPGKEEVMVLEEHLDKMEPNTRLAEEEARTVRVEVGFGERQLSVEAGASKRREDRCVLVLSVTRLWLPEAHKATFAHTVTHTVQLEAEVEADEENDPRCLGKQYDYMNGQLRFSFAMKAEEEERPPKMKKLSPAWRKIN